MPFLTSVKSFFGRTEPTRRSSQDNERDFEAVELQRFKVSGNIPSKDQKDIPDIRYLVQRISEIFNEQQMTESKRDKVFELTDELKNKIGMPQVQGMNKEFLLWEAEKITKKESLITDEESLSTLTPLAQQYREAYRSYKKLLISDKTIAFDDLEEKLKDLTSAYVHFFKEFTPIYKKKQTEFLLQKIFSRISSR